MLHQLMRLQSAVQTYRMREHSGVELVAWWGQNPISCHQFNQPKPFYAGTVAY
ncbi:hypothetical protein [Neobacillus vireti]|uniref:hypothetical protein n=1 Tax=Neobacillus vireti TaxID=220686 RepID=UPI002FFF1394